MDLTFINQLLTLLTIICLNKERFLLSAELSNGTVGEAERLYGDKDLIKLKDLAFELSYDYGEHQFSYHGRAKEFYNSTQRRLLTKDIQEINISPEFDMVIASTKNGVKLLSKNESKSYLKSKEKEILSELKRLWIIKKKIGLDQQITIDGKTIKVFNN